MTRPTTRWMLPLVLLALLAPPVLAADEAPGLDAAVAAFGEGRWKDAADAARAVGEDAATYAKARYVLGECCLVLGDAAAAEAAFQAVLAKRPDAVPAQVGLARALVLGGKAEAGLARIATTLEASPDELDALCVEGEAYLALGRTKDALRVLEKAHKKDRRNPMVARALVEAYLRAEDEGHAERVAKKLQKSLPKHPMGPFLLGLVLERRGDDDEAIEAYEEALARDDGFLDAHKNLAILCHTMSRTYQDRERVEKSLHHYERYFALGGHDPELEQTYRTTRSFLESRR